MKTLIIYLGIGVWLLGACQNKHAQPQPQPYIDQSKMRDIMCDLMLLDAIKAQSIPNNPYVKLRASEFVQKKYGVDSLTYARNVQWYAADAQAYQQLCKEVKAQLEANSPKP